MTDEDRSLSESVKSRLFWIVAILLFAFCLTTRFDRREAVPQDPSAAPDPAWGAKGLVTE